MQPAILSVVSPLDKTFSSSNAPGARPRIVAAEDDPDAGLALEVTLGSAYDVLVVPCGRELLQLLEQEPADLILLDYQLPDINGLRVMEAIRRRYGDATPAIAVSAFSHRRSACLQAGFSTFLQKPFGRVDLIWAVERGLRAAHPRGAGA
ncbi:MAG TPA: response regulator [Myxococcota bacterium]|nr:response regulator [Myxococcota bacterium]